MERLRAALIVALAILAAAVTGEIETVRVCGRLMEMTATISDSDTEIAAAGMDEMEDYWSRSEAIMRVYMHHEMLRPVGDAIEQLSEAVSSGNIDGIDEAVISTRKKIAELRDAEALRCYNIF